MFYFANRLCIAFYFTHYLCFLLSIWILPLFKLMINARKIIQEDQFHDYWAYFWPCLLSIYFVLQNKTENREIGYLFPITWDRRSIQFHVVLVWTFHPSWHPTLRHHSLWIKWSHSTSTYWAWMVSDMQEMKGEWWSLPPPDVIGFMMESATAWSPMISKRKRLNPASWEQEMVFSKSGS